MKNFKQSLVEFKKQVTLFYYQYEGHTCDYSYWLRLVIITNAFPKQQAKLIRDETVRILSKYGKETNRNIEFAEKLDLF